MSVQSSINQTVSLASILASQSGLAKNRQEAQRIKTKETAAQAGLNDIEENLMRENATSTVIDNPNLTDAEKVNALNEKEKEIYKKHWRENDYSRRDALKSFSKRYSPEELRNINERIGEFHRDIYDAKAARKNPLYSKFSTMFSPLSKGDISQKEVGSQLTRVREMTKRAEDRLNSENIQRQASKDVIKNLNNKINGKSLQTKSITVNGKVYTPRKSILDSVPEGIKSAPKERFANSIDKFPNQTDNRAALRMAKKGGL